MSPVVEGSSSSLQRVPPFAPGFPRLYPRPVGFRPNEGSVLARDIDGDGEVDLVVSVPAGVVTLLGSDGSARAGWPRRFDDLQQPAYPVGAVGIGDLDGDGSPEIVTCVVSGQAPRRSFLYALRLDGSDHPGWPVEIPSVGDGSSSCSPGGTLLVDLDGDGTMEVVKALNFGELHALDDDGLPVAGWPVTLGPDPLGHSRAINADLAAADLDGDGRWEVLCTEAGLGPRLAAITGDGLFMTGFPQTLQEVTDRQAPAAADLDNDGWTEIVQATLPFTGDLLPIQPFPTVTQTDDMALAAPTPGPTIPPALHVLRYDGAAAPGWPAPLETGGTWGALLVDLDGDGITDIVQDDGDQLVAFSAWGETLKGYPVSLRHKFHRSQSLLVSPWVATDLSGDGLPELLHARSNVYGGSTDLRIYALRPTGRPLRGFPFTVEGLLAASPLATADLTADGVPELILLTTAGANGGWRLIAWDLWEGGWGH